MSSKKVTKQKTAWDQQLNDLKNDAHPPKEQKTYENIPIVVIGDENISLSDVISSPRPQSNTH